jgi:sulfoxide reductase heme-binding subunit YedZ
MNGKRTLRLMFILMFILLTFASFVHAGPGDATGADPIFELLGVDKPADWGSWNKLQKHTYLRELGAYPARGNKYQGKISGLEPYFSKLGIVQPDNWMKMSFEGRKAYLAENLGNKSTQNTLVKSNNNAPSENVQNDIQYKYRINFYMPSIFGIISILFALLIGAVSFFPMKNRFRKYVKNGVYYVLPPMLFFFSIVHPERDFFNLIGTIAEYLLIFIMFVKPLSYIFSSKFFLKAVTYRKESGIASFWFFFFHAAGLIYILKIFNFSSYLIPYMFWGSIAGIGMAILALTSNKFSLRLMKKNWKKLQYIAYPVFFATLAHISLFQYDSLIKFYIVGGIYAILKSAQWLGLKA